LDYFFEFIFLKNLEILIFWPFFGDSPRLLRYSCINFIKEYVIKFVIKMEKSDEDKETQEEDFDDSFEFEGDGGD
jgi:hypothetical protein